METPKDTKIYNQTQFLQGQVVRAKLLNRLSNNEAEVILRQIDDIVEAHYLYGSAIPNNINEIPRQDSFFGLIDDAQKRYEWDTDTENDPNRHLEP